MKLTVVAASLFVAGTSAFAPASNAACSSTAMHGLGFASRPVALSATGKETFGNEIGVQVRIQCRAHQLRNA